MRSEAVLLLFEMQNSHAISELGMLVIKRLSQKSGDLQGGDELVSLPSMLYKPSDTKDEANAEVHISRTMDTFFLLIQHARAFIRYLAETEVGKCFF